jgi:hypothetical protein
MLNKSTPASPPPLHARAGTELSSGPLTAARCRTSVLDLAQVNLSHLRGVSARWHQRDLLISVEKHHSTSFYVLRRFGVIFGFKHLLIDWAHARRGFPSARNVSLLRQFSEWSRSRKTRIKSAFKVAPLYMIVVVAIVGCCGQTRRACLGTVHPGI